MSLSIYGVSMFSEEFKDMIENVDTAARLLGWRINETRSANKSNFLIYSMSKDYSSGMEVVACAFTFDVEGYYVKSRVIVYVNGKETDYNYEDIDRCFKKWFEVIS